MCMCTNVDYNLELLIIMESPKVGNNKLMLSKQHHCKMKTSMNLTSVGMLRLQDPIKEEHTIVYH